MSEMKGFLGGLILGLVFSLVGVNLARSQPKKSVGVVNSEKAIVRDAGNLTCYRYDRYFVISRPTEDVGTDILVKFPKNQQKFPCKYTVGRGDHEIKNQTAEFFYGISRNLLFLDSGTSPEGRLLIIHNLTTRKKVFQTDYYEPVEIDSKNKNNLTFWQENGIANRNNCPRYLEWQKNGLGAAIERRFILNLQTFRISAMPRTRCNARQ